MSKESDTEVATQARMIGELAAHPEFVALVKEINDAPEAERLATAERLADPQRLRERGVRLPAEFRLTTRYFENPNSLLTGSVLINPTGGASEIEPDLTVDEPIFRVTVCASLGYIACVSVGGEVLQ